jgi:hypothetical protein
MTDAAKWAIGPDADLSFRLSRIAHWLLNDSGFTKRQAALELAYVARKLSPDMAARTLGDAASLEPDDAQRLRHIAEHPEILSFLYDMLGEVYVKTNEAGDITAIRTGLKKPESDSLDAIRSLIDDDIDDKANGRNAFARISEGAEHG